MVCKANKLKKFLHLVTDGLVLAPHLSTVEQWRKWPVFGMRVIADHNVI